MYVYIVSKTINIDCIYFIHRYKHKINYYIHRQHILHIYQSSTGIIHLDITYEVNGY